MPVTPGFCLDCGKQSARLHGWLVKIRKGYNPKMDCKNFQVARWQIKAKTGLRGGEIKGKKYHCSDCIGSYMLCNDLGESVYASDNWHQDCGSKVH
jgi:hypothetical protein